MEENDILKNKFNEFIVETKKLAKRTNFRANLYIFMNNTINTLIIILGSVIGSLNIFISSNVIVLSAIFGFSISVLKCLQEAFKFPSKSVQLKSASLKFDRLVRSAERDIILFNYASLEERLNILTELYKQRDSIDLAIFSALIISNNIYPLQKHVECDPDSTKSPDIDVKNSIGSKSDIEIGDISTMK